MKKFIQKKKGFIILALVATILPSTIPVYASESLSHPQQKIQMEISPLWVYDYIETVEVSYQTAASIPSTYYYEYYHNTFGWMRGTLEYKSHTYSNGKYIATFTGRMMSNPL